MFHEWGHRRAEWQSWAKAVAVEITSYGKAIRSDTSELIYGVLRSRDLALGTSGFHLGRACAPVKTFAVAMGLGSRTSQYR
jgi:hypothetical protein